jgi:C4-dicarboxylate-specific signal transduction histidine kinase
MPTSVTFVSALSLWALVSGHWSAWQAARVEVTQREEEKAEAEHPVEQRVVERIIERTEVDPAPKKTEATTERSEEDATPQEDDRN